MKKFSVYYVYLFLNVCYGVGNNTRKKMVVTFSRFEVERYFQIEFCGIVHFKII